MGRQSEINSDYGLKKYKPKKGNKKLGLIILTVFILLCVVITIIVNDNFGNIFSNQIGNKYSRVIDSSLESSDFGTGKSQNSSDWKLILVNKWNYIPDNYIVSLMTLKNNFRIDKRIYPELQDMFDAARSAGIYPLISEAYRTAEEQKTLLDDKINSYISEGYTKNEAKILAKTWVAAPGTSEHQLGLALDINAENDKCTNEEVYDWLANNSYKYGFILRYPSDKIKITGTNYEPWHYRYVGKESAREIYNQGMCLEEYLENQK